MSDRESKQLPFVEDIFVVGIGASAGGLKALEELFQNIPANTGMAFVVIQHLSPNFKSLMKELLQKCTSMNIYRVTDGMKLAANSIYLIPSGKNLIVEQNRLRLLKQATYKGHRLNFPINLFFASLGKDYKNHAVGVVLSGTGSDGTDGLRAINEAGGLTMVQDPKSAEFDGMPRSAIATGIIDEILAPSALAEIISRLGRSPLVYQHLNNDQNIAINSSQLQKTIDTLAQHEQGNFAHYKFSTLARRIHRRCLINSCGDIEDYIYLLENSSEERIILCRDLLINVTQFFRDRSVWQFLENQVISQLIAKTPSGQELRFWVTACATGQEAYSLAIILDEAVQKARKKLKIKIFATDVNKEALKKATQGIYPLTIANEMSRERLKRYFVKKDQSYQVIRRIREKLLFAPHDLTKNAGFTNINLISCRNVLIYMQPELQQQILSKLHFSLNHQGVLFLGEAESLSNLEDEFQPLSQKYKIYQKRRELRLPFEIQDLNQLTRQALPLSDDKIAESYFEPIINQAFKSFLTQHKTACFLVDRDNNLFHIFNNYLEVIKFSTGRTTTDVTKLVIAPLELPLSNALYRARRERSSVTYTGISLGSDSEVANLILQVSYQEHSELAADFCLVTIQQENLRQLIEGERFQTDSEASQHIMELEYQLQQTKENLQAVIEELETTNEEQQATNEELIASNEELNSVNEELSAVNFEYHSKITELTELNNDIDNLLRSTDIGVVFLDRELKIRKFTPAAITAINLVKTDIGRPLEHITHNIYCDNFWELLQGVLQSQKALEQEVKLKKSDECLLMRINPYLQEDNSLDGIVLTFVNVSEMQKVQQQLQQTYQALEKSEKELRSINEDLEQRVSDRAIALQQSEQRLRAILDNTTSVVSLKDLNGNYILANPQFLELLNLPESAVIGKSDFNLFPQETAIALSNHDRQVIASQTSQQFEEILPLAAGIYAYIAIKTPLLDSEGKPYAVCSIASDITQQKQTEEALRKSATRERTTLKIVQKISKTLDRQEIFVLSTKELQEALQCDRVVIYSFNQDWSGQFVAESVQGDWRKLVKAGKQEVWLDTYLQKTQGGICALEKAFVIEDIYQADLSDCHVELLEEFQAKACCIVPIFQSDCLWGLLGVYQNSHFRRWQSEEIRLLTQVAIQLGITIQQIELFTQIRHQSKQLEQAKKAAVTANKAKTAFIANMNHELRTPLNAILGSAEILRQNLDSEAQQQNNLNLIEQSGRHLNTLIDDILSLAKIEAGKLTLKPIEFDFSLFLQNIVEIIRIRAYQKNITLDYQIISPLPSTVFGDETRLRQVLLNLLSNAIKFTPKGSVIFKVGYSKDFLTSSSHSSQHTIRFYVEDTGIGIAPSQVTDIFLPFHQLESNLQTEGTGLGLTISQNIVRLMGSEIKLQSTLGTGSIFWFDLDLANSHSLSNTHTIASKIDSPTATTALNTVNNTLIPPIAELDMLQEFLAMGNLRGVLNRITVLEESNPELASFTQQVRHLAESCQIDLLEEFLQSFN